METRNLYSWRISPYSGGARTSSVSGVRVSYEEEEEEEEEEGLGLFCPVLGVFWRRTDGRTQTGTDTHSQIIVLIDCLTLIRESGSH